MNSVLVLWRERERERERREKREGEERELTEHIESGKRRALYVEVVGESARNLFERPAESLQNLCDSGVRQKLQHRNLCLLSLQLESTQLNRAVTEFSALIEQAL